MEKKLNINEFLWFLILASFSIYFYKIKVTGQLGYFIHPKMFIYLNITLIAFIVLTLYQLTKIFSYKSSKKIKKGYLIFFVPLFLGISVNPKGLDAEAAENRGLMLVQDSKFKDSIIANINRENKIELNETNFYKTFNNIYGNLTEYRGKDITFEGFITRDKNLSSKQFMVGRMLVNCCAADGQVVGFVCEYGQEFEFRSNQWVKVTGIIDYETVSNEKKPVIKVINLQEITEPKDKYIYP